MPAFGLAQITHVADLDMRQVTARVETWEWMVAEVESWPRDPRVHTPDVAEAATDSLLAARALGPSTEYLFDPLRAARAGVFWLRLLADAWLGGSWAGDQGEAARRIL